MIKKKKRGEFKKRIWINYSVLSFSLVAGRGIEAVLELGLGVLVLGVLTELGLLGDAHEGLSAHLADDGLGLGVGLELAVGAGGCSGSLGVTLSFLLGSVTVSTGHF